MPFFLSFRKKIMCLAHQTVDVLIAGMLRILNEEDLKPMNKKDSK
jgi:hypothetical protein